MCVRSQSEVKETLLAILLEVTVSFHQQHLFQVKGDGSASLETPPNHRNFPFVPAGSKAQPSVLHQRRQAAQNVAGSSTTSPVFNINIPKEAMALFANAHAVASPALTHAAAPVGTALPVTPVSEPLAHGPDTPLYPPNMKPTHQYSLTEFCNAHSLSEDILGRFTAQGFTTFNQLCYISLNDLKDMQFKRGEIAAIQDSIAIWRASLAR